MVIPVVKEEKVKLPPARQVEIRKKQLLLTKLVKKSKTHPPFYQ